MLFVSNNDGDGADSESEMNSESTKKDEEIKRKQKAPQGKGNWKEFSQKNPVPPRRRFAPTEPCFQLPSTLDWSAFNLVSLFLSQATIQAIVQNTSEYAARIAAKQRNHEMASGWSVGVYQVERYKRCLLHFSWYIIIL